jgi:C-terminal peptidase prc
MVVNIERAAITIPAEQHQMLPGNIGVLVLHNDFSAVASAELRRALVEMLDAGMQGLIFDLRNNSGGLLDEAVNVCELFLPRGSLVTSTESRTRPSEKLYTSKNPVLPADMPMVCLVNRFSASAAEIVSGALQDHGRATVIGQRSYGKGSVQNLIPLLGMRDDVYTDENNNHRWDTWEPITKDWNGNKEFDFAPRIKLTIARYLLPSGRSIHREVDKDGNILNQGGIIPDVKIDSARTETWRIEEMVRVRDSKAPRDYVERNWGEYKDRFAQIAENDRKDVTLYPKFQEFYDSLHTPLAPDDVRQLLRGEIRRRVQDARGQEFPQGDFVEDLQLQAGIKDILAKLGGSPDDFPDYKATISPASTTPRLNVASAEQRDMRDALEALKKALKGDRKLPDSALSELVQLLESSLKN